MTTLAFPTVARYAVDYGITAGAPGPLLTAVLLGLGIVALSWVVVAVQTVVTARAGESLLYLLRVRSYAHLQRLGLDYYERELSGRIMTRMTTDVDALSSFLQTGLAQAVVSLLTVVGVAVALLVTDPELALVALAVLPVLIVATLWFRVLSSRAYAEARERVAVVNADMQENVTGVRVAQAFTREQYSSARVRRPQPGLPSLPAAGAALHRDVLPVRRAAERPRDGRGARRRCRPRRRGRADARRAHRVPALPRLVLRTRPAALPGLRRLPAGPHRAAAHR